MTRAGTSLEEATTTTRITIKEEMVIRSRRIRVAFLATKAMTSRIEFTIHRVPISKGKSVSRAITTRMVTLKEPEKREKRTTIIKKRVMMKVKVENQ